MISLQAAEPTLPQLLEREVPLPLPESCPDDGCPETIDSDVTG